MEITSMGRRSARVAGELGAGILALAAVRAAAAAIGRRPPLAGVGSVK